ncbi:MAG: response regulator [Desulfobulbaceae bacterium]|uniref:Response regulator n=1 Tax=Candidatus Desulfatifera sulfidica TaxID=2841691 RepID=A0A8J6TA63_9BACT|nr:response regulator [Candidatus Desulfatifera sulfidica]
MSCITIFSGDFCHGSSVVKEVLDRTGYKLITDNTLINEACKLSGMNPAKIESVFSAKTSIFNKFTHEKEHATAYLRLAMANMLSEHKQLFSGYMGHLVPRDISHILNVCLVADIDYRLKVANEEQGLETKEAAKMINQLDSERARWVHSLHNEEDPWSPSLYDMVIPMNKTTVKEAAVLIVEYLSKDILKPTESCQRRVADFLLSAQVEVSLAREGHSVQVMANQGNILLTINKHVLMLSRLKEELQAITTQIPGVQSVECRIGKGFHKSDIYRKFDFDIPSKVLLVDDEREFVHTLSERLALRDMGSAVAEDGESALKLIAEDQPEVIVLDLKMPGIDGIEVLRRVKASHPEVEVIVLTGHGSEADRKTCMDLGAMAYMHKPVDIDKLSRILEEANRKVHEAKQQ